MNQHYIAPNGEIIEPAYFEFDWFDPADPPRAAVKNDAGVETEPAHLGTVLYAAGVEIPIAMRFTAEFVSALRAYDPVAEPNPPEREPPHQPPMTSAQAQSLKDNLLALATARIAPLQDAVDLGEATAEETALLTKWKQYRVGVNRVNVSVLPITWPVQPE